MRGSVELSTEAIDMIKKFTDSPMFQSIPLMKMIDKSGISFNDILENRKKLPGYDRVMGAFQEEFRTSRFDESKMTVVELNDGEVPDESNSVSISQHLVDVVSTMNTYAKDKGADDETLSHLRGRLDDTLVSKLMNVANASCENSGRQFPRELLDGYAVPDKTAGGTLIIARPAIWNGPDEQEKISPRSRREYAKRRMLNQGNDRKDVKREVKRVDRTAIRKRCEKAGVESGSINLSDVVESNEMLLEIPGPKFECSGCGKSSKLEGTKRWVISCSFGCQMMYHIKCWKIVKEEMGDIHCAMENCDGSVCGMEIRKVDEGCDRILRRRNADVSSVAIEATDALPAIEATDGTPAEVVYSFLR